MNEKLEGGLGSPQANILLKVVILNYVVGTRSTLKTDAVYSWVKSKNCYVKISSFSGEHF